MTIPQHIADREYQKFVQDGDGNTAVRTLPGTPTDDDGDKLEINSDGSVNVKSLDIKVILCSILVELQKLNLHHQVITDEEFQNKDV